MLCAPAGQRHDDEIRRKRRATAERRSRRGVGTDSTNISVSERTTPPAPERPTGSPGEAATATLVAESPHDRWPRKRDSRGVPERGETQKPRCGGRDPHTKGEAQGLGVETPGGLAAESVLISETDGIIRIGRRWSRENRRPGLQGGALFRFVIPAHGAQSRDKERRAR